MKVKVSFQTLHLPPPFAQAYTLELDFGSSEIAISFDLEYLNRDEISIEEIEGEGFTGDDDYSWEGKLGKPWIDVLKDDIVKATLNENAENDPFWLHIDVDGRKMGIPEDLDGWDFRFQELIQAIYEKAGIEEALKIKFIDINQGISTYYELNGSFIDRTCSINKKHISWQDLQQFMSEVYSLEFGEITPIELPKRDDLWIDPDGSTGYFSLSDLAGANASKHKKSILKVLI